MLHLLANPKALKIEMREDTASCRCLLPMSLRLGSFALAFCLRQSRKFQLINQLRTV